MLGQVLNRAKVNTATTGTGTVTLGAAVVPFQTFAAAGARNKSEYCLLIEDGNDWEVSEGVYDSTGPTLTRVLIASSTGSLLNLSGSATVCCIARDANSNGLKPAGHWSGRYYPPDTQTFTTAATTTAANGIYALPFTKAITIDAIALEITTLVAASNVRFGLYDCRNDGYPGVLIDESAAVSTATTGIKVGTLSLGPHKMTRPVWLCALFSHTPGIRGGTPREEAFDWFGGTSFNLATSSGAHPRLFATQAYGPYPIDASALAWGSGNSAFMLAARAL